MGGLKIVVYLVGGFNPVEKYWSESFPRVDMKITNI